MTLPPGFFTLHRDLPREGPGSAASVDWVLARMPAPGLVADVACGPGADTVTLAERLPGARIEALDLTPHFVAEAARRCARFGPRVTARQGDMRDLASLVSGPVDLIWCMGALYALGIETALPLWRPALAPGGRLAFSEPVFLTDPPGPGARAFWADYPAVTDAAGIKARIETAGYRLLDATPLTGEPWADYYHPQQARIAALRPGADAELAAVLDAAETEIALLAGGAGRGGLSALPGGAGMTAWHWVGPGRGAVCPPRGAPPRGYLESKDGMGPA